VPIEEEEEDVYFYILCLVLINFFVTCYFVVGYFPAH